MRPSMFTQATGLAPGSTERLELIAEALRLAHAPQSNVVRPGT